jgi:hypothetical protein
MDINNFSEEVIFDAHRHSFENEEELRKSHKCGCFYCLQIFEPEQITDDSWCDDENSRTAECPFCGIDAVIGDASGYPITKEFLATMKDAWFDHLA